MIVTNICNILSKNENDNSIDKKNISVQWRGKHIHPILKENPRLQKTLSLPNFILDFDRKGNYMAIVNYVVEGLVDINLVRLDPYELLCSHLVCVNDNVYSKQIHLTNDLHLVIPCDRPNKAISIYSEKEHVSIDICDLRPQSVRVAENEIYAHTKSTFFVFNTEGEIIRQHLLPDGLEPSRKISCTNGYYIAQLGSYTTEGWFTIFHATSSFFVADLKNEQVCYYKINPPLKDDEYVSELVCLGDFIYIATCTTEYYKENCVTLFKNPKIYTFNLKNYHQSCYLSDFKFGSIKHISGDDSNLAILYDDLSTCLLEAVSNRCKTWKRYKLEIINLNGEKKIFDCDDKNFHLNKNLESFNKTTFFYPSLNSLCIDNQLKPFSSIPNDAPISLDLYSSYDNGILVTIPNSLELVIKHLTSLEDSDNISPESSA